MSPGLLQKGSIDQKEWKGREICIEISAEIDPQEITMEGARRQDQQAINNEVISDSFEPGMDNNKLSLSSQDASPMTTQD